MRSFLITVVSLSLALSAYGGVGYGLNLKEKSQFQDNVFQNQQKDVQTLWASIPFFAGGDLGQFEKTMSQDRDQVRKMFWQELMSEVQKLAEKGVAVEAMLESMANILMMFDQVHDVHKAKDVIKIDYTLENQFKASLDQLYKKNDIRDDQRKVQISKGTQAALLESYIRGISAQKPLGDKITSEELNVKFALEMLNQIDFISYGTFSSLGKGQFQLTFHLQGNKNGVTRNFLARGRLAEALDDLAKQVFDFFQKNTYEDWSAPGQSNLVWLPMPINLERQKRMEESGVYEAYGFAEAKNYCQARGYRLPFAREILMAESGTEYKQGGIGSLRHEARYAVADRRSGASGHWIVSKNSDRTGGPFMADGELPLKGLFWCVKGEPSSEMKSLDEVWSLIRKHRTASVEVLSAFETLRAELGDFDSGNRMIFHNGQFVKIEVLGSVNEALEVLKKNNITVSAFGK